MFSCNAVKHVKDGEHLLTKNTIEVDGKVNTEERVNNIPLQKPNTTLPIPFTNIPFRLHIHNLARPNIDSILQTKVYDDSSKVRRKTKLLSRKQLDKEILSRKKFNAWLKRSGEAPTILSEDRTERTSERLRKYYYKRGFIDNTVDFEIQRDSNKRAQVKYTVNKNAPYTLDSLITNIKTPIIDSIYNRNTNTSFIKKGQQYDEDNYIKEIGRINNLMRNSGVYHFTQDYLRVEIDTFKTTNTFNAELFITDRVIRDDNNNTRTEPFKVYKIKDVNIFTDATNENRIANKKITDSITSNGYRLYSYDQLKFKPQALTDAVFIEEGSLYRDIDRTRTSRYLNQLQMFKSLGIDYIPNEQDTTLTANIYLSPDKKYSWTNEVNLSQSNIQTAGVALSTGLKIRNAFKGAETLDISFLGSIGASRNSNANDSGVFFDINEFGITAALTIPRFYIPFNTDRIIPKFMSPTTKINITATGQQNIGLDRQTLSSVFAYNWFPSNAVTNNLELFNIQYVRNLNVGNYFDVYANSFNRLNTIAQDIGFIGSDEILLIDDPRSFEPANTFIQEVIDGNTSLTPDDNDFIAVSNIEERRQRLTEDNLIISTNFDYKKDWRTNNTNKFSSFKFHVELAGNILSSIYNLTGSQRNEDGRFEALGVTFSQYFKTEFDYIKYWDFGGKNILAMRSFFGVAIPYGNSDNIPFAESYFAGGPNDNRAWTAYDLGPGRSQNIEEFNEANLKLHFSLEQRFNLFGSIDGAIFIDAGNIWNAFGNVDDDPDSTFNNLEDLQDIAVGSGFGIRYDFDLFVLRGDIGFRTYDPSLNQSNRWFRDYNFGNATYNIGINYPF
ncbi:BamA/TamA family outer membrane protein [Winogradskyella sp. E313]|uniref:BamA/TamA family outer membrane protein n=1 Tax=Winogradskyella immobilis TaxID=2816852 RepID=A0ABS8EJ52_9FLAO|nr:BamA/TamA family outer membrane protein [Winogradskyella immobilis]